MRDTFFELPARRRALQQLKSAAERSKSGGKEIVFISGSPGSGKSTLLKSLRNDERIFFSSANFDKMDTLPFAAITSLLVDIIISICENESLKQKMMDSMSSQMTQEEIKALNKFCPEFHRLGSWDDNEFATEKSPINEFNRVGNTSLAEIQFVISSFLKILSIQSSTAITLCFFGIHWADEPSISILDFLLEDSELNRFLFVFTYINREDIQDKKEEREHFYIWKSDIKIRLNHTPLCLHLENLRIDDMSTILASSMKLSDIDILAFAAVLMIRTKGNLFFTLQIFESLKKDCVIIYDEASRKWKWDPKVFQINSLPNELLDLVSYRIQRLPLPFQHGLQLAACLGEKFSPLMLSAICRSFGTPVDIDELMRVCLKERLLEMLSDGRAMFLSQEIRQAALTMLPKGEDLGKVHLKIGLDLLSYLEACSMSDHSLLFLCADQLSLGLSHMTCKESKLSFVRLNELVGRKAQDLSSFGIAATYFKKGIDVLQQNNILWEDHRDLFEALYLGLAKVQYNIGQFDSSMEAINELLLHSPSKSVSMNAKLTKLYILKAGNELKEFISASLKFLSELGYCLKDTSAFVCSLELRKTIQKLKGMSDDDILDLPMLLDVNILAVMKVLILMWIPLQTLGMVNLCFIVINKAVLLSLDHGISELSPEAFALLGTYLISEKNMICDGYHMGELALSMMRTLNSKYPSARVHNLVFAMIRPWHMTPLSHCIAPLLDGHAAAIKVGDSFSAFMAIHSYFCVSYSSSSALRPLLRDIDKFAKQMLKYGQKTIFLQTLPIWQCVLNLTGKCENLLDFEQGDAMMRQYQVGNVSDVEPHSLCSYKMQMAFYAGKLELASELATSLKKMNTGLIKAHAIYPKRIFFFGLIAISNARRFGRMCYYKLEARMHIRQMRRWVEQRAANLVHKLLILESEYDSLTAKNGSVLQTKYDTAIAAARKSGFLQDAAIAAQLAGEALCNFEDTRAFADTYFLAAHEMWILWGANALSQNLSLRKREKFPLIRFDSFRNDASDGAGRYYGRDRFDSQLTEVHFKRHSVAD